MGVSYFFDSYAVIEIIEDNPKYLALLDNVGFAISLWNLLEVHQMLLRQYGPVFADHTFDSLRDFLIEIPDDVIKEASKMRYAMKKRKLSYVDCIGYCMAKRMGIEFLTGDIQFRDLKHVRYVK
jgi:predicted nucleic acid-binding protein